MRKNLSTIFVVDDDPLARSAMVRLLRGAGYRSETFASAEAFLAWNKFETPSCILLDLLNARGPGLNGLELQRALVAADRRLPIVFVTGSGDVSMSVRAMKAGAVDFLLKPLDSEELLKTIGRALKQSQLAHNERTELSEIRRRLSTLTSREREVLSRLIAGQINKQIAADLGTVEKTIKVHRGRIMEKMGSNSFAELVRMVVRIEILAAGRTELG
jgi:FixJ family two-component response regulator